MLLQRYLIIVDETSVLLTNVELQQRYDLHNVISNAAFDSESDGCRRAERRQAQCSERPLNRPIAAQSLGRPKCRDN